MRHPRLICITVEEGRGEVEGSQNEFAHIWHIILQLLWARRLAGAVWGSLGCGLWVAVMLPKDKLSTSCCDFDGLFECLRVCEAV